MSRAATAAGAAAVFAGRGTFHGVGGRAARGGPTGGSGERGRTVISRLVAGPNSLRDVVNRKPWRAELGGACQPDNCHGRRGRDLIIPVPPGTLVRDRDRGHILRDLTENAQE